MQDHRPQRSWWTPWRKYCSTDGEPWPCSHERQRRVTALQIRIGLEMGEALREADAIYADGEAYARRMQHERLRWWMRGAR